MDIKNNYLVVGILIFIFIVVGVWYSFNNKNEVDNNANPLGVVSESSKDEQEKFNANLNKIIEQSQIDGKIAIINELRKMLINENNEPICQKINIPGESALEIVNVGCITVNDLPAPQAEFIK